MAIDERRRMYARGWTTIRKAATIAGWYYLTGRGTDPNLPLKFSCQTGSRTRELNRLQYLISWYECQLAR